MGDLDLQLEAGPFRPGGTVTGRLRTRESGPVSAVVDMSQVSRVPGTPSKYYDWKRSPGAEIRELDYRYDRLTWSMDLALSPAGGGWSDVALPLPATARPTVSTARAGIELLVRFEIGGHRESASIQIASPGGHGEPATGFPPLAEATRAGWNADVRQLIPLTIESEQVPRGGVLRVRPEGSSARGLGRLAQRVGGVRSIALQCEEETALGEGYEKMFFASPDYSRQIVVDERAPIGPHGDVELTVPRDAPYSFPGEIVAWRWRVAALGPGGVVLGAAPVTVTTGVV